LQQQFDNMASLRPPKDEKYVVFKREEWNAFLGECTDALPAGHGVIDPDAIEDAVVIRRQDVFAPPALDAYANAILIAVEALKKAGDLELLQRADTLVTIADYFHQQATAAWLSHREFPD
jgi:hypothetical protein